MGKEKIIIDTNNIIAAIGWNGNSRQIITMATQGLFDLYIPTKQIEELKRVLDYPKFKFSEFQKEEILQLLQKIGNLTSTTKILKIAEDCDDNIFLECAVEIDADYIISGDKHLLKIKQINNTKIISAKEYLIKKEKHQSKMNNIIQTFAIY
jgi:uncharacterized protein